MKIHIVDTEPWYPWPGLSHFGLARIHTYTHIYMYIRHENSIDNVPLHMSISRARRVEKGREGWEGRREKSVGDAITALWGAYPGDLCSSCEACPLWAGVPLIVIDDLLAASFAPHPLPLPSETHFFCSPCGTFRKGAAEPTVMRNSSRPRLWNRPEGFVFLSSYPNRIPQHIPPPPPVIIN